MKNFIIKHGLILVAFYFFALAIMICMIGCVPESNRRTSDYIWKGSKHINDNTPSTSPLKKDTAALEKLAHAHSKYEEGEPEKPIADKWDSKIAEKRAEEIKTDYGTWGLWLGSLSLFLFLASRGLKAIGIYAPQAWLKDAVATIFKPPVKEVPKES